MEQEATILVVDDDESSRHLYREVFRNAGFHVLTASDGLEGLDIAIRERPDIIFTGIVMPRMDAFEMMRNLQKNVKTSTIPVIIFSHLGREEDKRKAQELGAKDFIVRSIITPQQVVERVKAYLGRKSYYYLAFDPAALDAAKLGETFNFPPYFECSDGKRMVIKLIPLNEEKGKQIFRAEIVCPEK